jgi:hypothetical protein
MVTDLTQCRRFLERDLKPRPLNTKYGRYPSYRNVRQSKEKKFMLLQGIEHWSSGPEPVTY